MKFSLSLMANMGPRDNGVTVAVVPARAAGIFASAPEVEKPSLRGQEKTPDKDTSNTSDTKAASWNDWAGQWSHDDWGKADRTAPGEGKKNAEPASRPFDHGLAAVLDAFHVPDIAATD